MGLFLSSFLRAEIYTGYTSKPFPVLEQRRELAEIDCSQALHLHKLDPPRFRIFTHNGAASWWWIGRLQFLR